MKKTFGILLIVVGCLTVLIGLTMVPGVLLALLSAIKETSANRLGGFAGFATAFLLVLLLGILSLVFGTKLIKKKKREFAKSKPVKQPTTQSLITVCGKCETENKSTSNYCNRCGYALVG